MQVTNRDVWQATAALAVLGRGQKFPVLKSLEIAQLSRALNGLREPIEDVRVELIGKWADLDEKGRQQLDPIEGGIQLTDKVAFTKEFNELMDKPVSANGLKPLKLPEITAFACPECHHNMDKPFEIEPSILVLLLPFLEI